MGISFLQPSWGPIIPHYRNQAPRLLHFHDQGKATRKTSRLEIRNVPTYPEPMFVVPRPHHPYPGRHQPGCRQLLEGSSPTGACFQTPRVPKLSQQRAVIGPGIPLLPSGRPQPGDSHGGRGRADSPVPTLVATAGEHVLGRHLHADVPIGADADSV